MNASYPTAHLGVPELRMEGEGKVSSAQFGDVYFSRHDGAAETRHVFLQGNGLPEGWQGRPHFTIGELGFGTGLNFMVAHAEFLRTTTPDQHLHYLSVEKFPLTRAQLLSLHRHCEERSDAAIQTKEPVALSSGLPRGVYPGLCAGARNDEFLDYYPLRLPGWHRIHLERCTLTLGFGDAEELLRGADARVDAWFLDGFAPAKNAEMWGDTLLRHVARLTAPGGRCATFTAAGAVKRSLSAHGFTMQKVQGFAHKRDMLVGTCSSPLKGEVRRGPEFDTDLAQPRLHPNPPPQGEGIIVIGAGIAGAMTARALAERGVVVTVLERDVVANAASGNRAAVLYPQLTKFYTPATAWHGLGYALMLRQLPRWQAAGLTFTWHTPGILRFVRDGSAQGLLQTLQIDPDIARYVSQEEASDITGMPVMADGIYLPQGGWISPAKLCRALLQHPRITLQERTAANTIARASDGWVVNGILRASQLVLCNAQAATALLPDALLPMTPSAGQVTVVKAPASVPRCITSHHGYVIPVGDECLLGATYDREDLSCALTQKNHEENMQHAREALPSWETLEVVGGRTSLRATTPDRLPYVGALEAGLYVNLGHGSRGMISAPLAAEVIAAQITGEMVPLTPELLAAVSPLRRNK